MNLPEFSLLVQLHHLANTANGTSSVKALKMHIERMATSSLESWSHYVAGVTITGLSEELEEPRQWRQSDELWRQTHSGWEEVTIAEEAEDGEAMEEKVWLPSAASTPLIVLFFSLAVELQRNSLEHSDTMNQAVIAAQLGQTAQRRVVTMYSTICTGVASGCGEAAVLQVRL